MPEIISTSEISFWKNRYEVDQIGWHIEGVHGQLKKHLDLVTGGQPGAKVFVPLCGKTVDIPYLLSKGHTVFGVEAVASAIYELGKEQGLGLQWNKDESIFFTEDERLKIFCGDFFQCPIEKYGPFDVIWDRGSFIAIDYELRAPYVEVMKRALQKSQPNPEKKFHDFKYLLQTVRYDKNLFGGIPRTVDPDDISQYFDDSWAEVKCLDRFQAPEDSPMRKVSKDMPDDILEMTFLIQPH